MRPCTPITRLLKYRARKSGAIAERITVDTHYAVTNRHARTCAATAECITADIRSAIRDCYAR